MWPQVNFFWNLYPGENYASAGESCAAAAVWLGGVIVGGLMNDYRFAHHVTREETIGEKQHFGGSVI